MNSHYLELLKDPRWQKKRLEVFERAGWACQCCGEKTKPLHVHHLVYSGGKPWEADGDSLECLCWVCHEFRTDFDKMHDRCLMPTKLCWEHYCSFDALFEKWVNRGNSSN